jgi:ABC-type uncharacterized transport system, permease component
MENSGLLPVLGALALAFYLLAGWFALRRPQVPLWTPALALALHGVALGMQIYHGSALRFGIPESASLFAWQSAATLWVFSRRDQLDALGIVLYPLVGLLALAGAIGSNARGDVIPISDWRIQMHILLSLFAAGLLTVACFEAIALAVLDRLLHRPGNLAMARRLPPMQTLEGLLFRLVFAGFFLLSLTLVSGLLFVHNLFAQHLAQKTVLSVLAWLIFGVLLWGRRRYGWRGRTAIRWALTGYATLIIAYFGSKLFVEQVFGTHWS